MIINSGASDIVYTAAISGVSANFLRPSLELMGITEEMLSRTKKIDFGNELTAMEQEAKAWSTIWSAGQGVTTIQDNPSVKKLVKKMKEEFINAIKEQNELLKLYK
jgi:nitronate monooxygenase